MPGVRGVEIGRRYAPGDHPSNTRQTWAATNPEGCSEGTGDVRPRRSWAATQPERCSEGIGVHGRWVGVGASPSAQTATDPVKQGERRRAGTPTPPTAFERSLVVWSRRCVAGFRGSLLVGSRAEFRCPRPCSRTSRPVLRLVGRALSRRLGVSSSSSRGREHGHAATLFEGICVLCRGLVFHVHVLAVGSRVTRPVRAGARTSRRVSPSDAPGGEPSRPSCGPSSGVLRRNRETVCGLVVRGNRPVLSGCSRCSPLVLAGEGVEGRPTSADGGVGGGGKRVS